MHPEAFAVVMDTWVVTIVTGIQRKTIVTIQSITVTYENCPF